MNPILVLDVVGLSPALLRHAPRIAAVAKGGFSVPLRPVVPAVTCTAQSTMLTGLPPSGHGIVGNGWYDRERAEVGFWKQSAHLVRGERGQAHGVALMVEIVRRLDAAHLAE